MRGINHVRYGKMLTTFRKSEVIFEEGSLGSEMYVVASGRVKIYQNSEEGEIEIAVFSAGEFFGEMALVDDAPRSACACALEDNTGLIALDRDKFMFLVSHQPTFALVIMHELCQRTRFLTQCLYQKDKPV